MADEKDRKEQAVTRNEPTVTREATVPPVSPASTVASSIAAMIVEDNLRQGRVVEIPSLGIKITSENLHEPDREVRVLTSAGKE
jgi:hypothetical protein